MCTCARLPLMMLKQDPFVAFLYFTQNGEDGGKIQAPFLSMVGWIHLLGSFSNVEVAFVHIMDFKNIK